MESHRNDRLVLNQTLSLRLTILELILTIRDRGQGMSAEVLRRLSEPFFTTKEPGEGMGLGVFLARTTIERLGGSLRVESAVAQGTTVHVHLPVQNAH